MFSNDDLQALIRGEMIGDNYPYSSNNDIEVQNYLKQLLAELKRNGISCEVEPDHHGSGYASYRQWFCYTKEHVHISTNKYTRAIEKEGLMIHISSLAPVVIIGVGNQWETYLLEDNRWLSGGSSMLSEPHELIIPSQFEALYNQLERLLMKYNFTILRKEDVEGLLPFHTKITTLLREKERYLIWDAIFYWED